MLDNINFNTKQNVEMESTRYDSTAFIMILISSQTATFSYLFHIYYSNNSDN